MKNRRSFLQLSALGIAGAVAKPSFALGSFEAPTTFPLGFAGYSFARFDIDKMIAYVAKAQREKFIIERNSPAFEQFK